MKSWVYKRENCKSHQIKTLSKDIAGMSKGSKMLIANTKIFDDFINKIPSGDFVEIKKLEVHLPNNLIVMLHVLLPQEFLFCK